MAIAGGAFFGYRELGPAGAAAVGRVQLGIWELEGKIPTSNVTYSGNALDNYPLITLFRRPSEILLIQTWDERLTVKLSQDGVAYQDEFEIHPDKNFGSWLRRYSARGFALKNTTPGVTARYQFVAFD